MSSPSLMTPPPSPITSPPSCLTLPTPFSACSSIPSPSFEKVDQLFAFLAECSNKPAILALVKDYSIPSSLAADLPLCLTDINNTEYLKNHSVIYFKLWKRQRYLLVLPKPKLCQRNPVFGSR